MNKKIIIFFTILLIQNNIFAGKFGAYGTEVVPYIDMTNQYADTFVDFKYGFEIKDGFATLKTNVPVKNKIMFAHTKSVLELESDTLLDSSFNFDFKSTSSQLELSDFKNYGSAIQSVGWNPNGNYVAIGGFLPDSGNELQIYSFNSISGLLSALPIQSRNYGSQIHSLSWSNDGNFLAIGGINPTSGNELQIYSFNSGTGVLSALPVDSRNTGGTIYSLDWISADNYLAIGAYDTTSGNELLIYSFNTGTGTLSALPVDSKNYGGAWATIKSTNWHPTGNYLAIGGRLNVAGNELQIYSFNSGTGTLSLGPIDSRAYGTEILSISWIQDGTYIAIGGDDPISGDELQIYSFNSGAGTLSAIPVDSRNYGTRVHSVNWSNDKKYLAIGGSAPTSNNELEIYSFDGTTGDLSSSPINSIDYGSRIFSVKWNYDDTYLAIGGNSPTYGNELHIYSFSANAIDTNEGHIAGNQNSLILNGNLTIPNDKKVEFLRDTIIDGQNKTLELGDDAQLIIDSNVTLTLRNMTIQTGINANKKPIELYMDGALCLQNTKIILDDDFLFENGNLFINEDVKFAGPHAFIYSSTHKCYINKNSKIKFIQDATFTYSPKSNDRNLIIMQNKSSKLTFKNSTLATTYTGLRLTKGNIIFDGLVTVTHLNINTNISSETTTQTSNITFQDLLYTITYPNGGTCTDFSPNGKLLAIGGNYHDGIGTGQILSINNYDEILTITSIPFPTQLNTVSFSPNGKFLATGGARLPTGLNCGILYKIDEDGYLEYATEISYTATGHINPQIRDITWSLDSKFIVVSGNGQNGEGAYIYKIDRNGKIIGTTMFPVPYSFGEAACFSPDGKFLAAGGWHSPRTYRFNFDGSITELSILDYPSSATSAIFSMQYSHDQKYLIAGGWRNGSLDNIRIFSIDDKGQGTLYWTIPTNIADAKYISWNEDGKNIVVASGPVNAPSPNYSKIYTLDLPNKTIIDTKNILFGDGTGYTDGAAVSPDLRIYAFAGQWDTPLTSTTNVATYIFSPVYDELITTSILYGNNNLHARGLDNYVTFGNASIGNSENLYIDILSGSKVDVHGTLNIENVL